MRIGAIILVIWLIIGVVAADQRHYFSGGASCARAGNIAVTVVAGPLNYLGVNPKVACKFPTHPSSG